MEGVLDADIQPISDAMNAILKDHGLHEDETWFRGEGPKEFWDLD
jgi:hypothetical protein